MTGLMSAWVLNVTTLCISNGWVLNVTTLCISNGWVLNVTTLCISNGWVLNVTTLCIFNDWVLNVKTLCISNGWVLNVYHCVYLMTGCSMFMQKSRHKCCTDLNKHFAELPEHTARELNILPQCPPKVNATNEWNNLLSKQARYMKAVDNLKSLGRIKSVCVDVLERREVKCVRL